MSNQDKVQQPMYKNAWFLLGVSVVVAVGVTFFITSSIMDTTEEVQALEEDRTSLEKDSEKLTEENASLEEENEALKIENEEITNEYGLLIQYAEELQSEVDSANEMINQQRSSGDITNPILDLDEEEVLLMIQADAEEVWEEDEEMASFRAWENAKAYYLLKEYIIDTEEKATFMEESIEAWGDDIGMVKYTYEELLLESITGENLE